MKEYLFSYGTLQDEKVQIELFGRILIGACDILKGYRISTIQIKDELFLSKSSQPYYSIAINSGEKEDGIDGVAFEISQEELLLADQYEPEEYKRIDVKLESGKNAWVYVSA
jgi:hypothetical protein